MSQMYYCQSNLDSFQVRHAHHGHTLGSFLCYTCLKMLHKNKKSKHSDSQIPIHHVCSVSFKHKTCFCVLLSWFSLHFICQIFAETRKRPKTHYGQKHYLLLNYLCCYLTKQRKWKIMLQAWNEMAIAISFPSASMHFYLFHPLWLSSYLWIHNVSIIFNWASQRTSK